MQKSFRSVETGKGARNVFPEIKFLRLNPAWQESSKASSLSGGDACAGQVFKRFELKLKRSVMLDFWHRGHSVSDSTASKFRELLTSWRCMAGKELLPLVEVLGIASDSIRRDGERVFVSQIESAEVGAIHQKMVLAIRWLDPRLRRKFLSIYFCGSTDGKTVHEIHFSAPQDEFDKFEHVYTETLRSIQWNAAVPPPMCTAPAQSSMVPVMAPMMVAIA